MARAWDANLAAYDLRPLRNELVSTLGDGGLSRRRAEVLRPVLASLSGSLVDRTAAQPFQYTGPTSSLTISNMGAEAVEVQLSMVVEGVGPAQRALSITSPDQPDRVFELTRGRGEPIAFRVTAAPGRTVVELSATGEASTVPGTEGKQVAALKVGALTAVATSSEVNSASLQEFVAASPPAVR